MSEVETVAGPPGPDATQVDRDDQARSSGRRRRPRGPVRTWLRTLRPSAVFDVEDLTPRQKAAYCVLLCAAILLPLLSAAIVLAEGWRPTGDNALIGLRVHDVLTGHFPLIGQPTTGENFGSGVATSHPGPIEFYLVAPFVLVLGPIVGLAIGAALINSVAMGGIAWTAHRRGGMGLMFISVLATVAMARSLGGNLLHDPVSSNVGSVMALLLLFQGWSIVAGDVRVAPAFVFVGTFALQDHLTYLGTGTPVVLLAIGVGLWWANGIRRRSKHPEQLRLPMRAALVLGTLMWFPVLWDELFGDHNLTAIFKTFTGGRTKGSGVRFAVDRLGDALAPWPMFSRRAGFLGYLHTPNTRELVTGYAVLAIIAGLGVFFALRKRTDLAALAVVAWLGAFAGAYSAVKLPHEAGIQASNLRWMWTVSAFCWVAAAWLIWEALRPVWQQFLAMPAVLLGTLCLLLALRGVVATMDLETDRDGRVVPQIRTLVGRLEDKVPKGRYLVRYGGGSVVVTIGPAVFNTLEHAGYDLLIADLGPPTRAYADHRAYHDGDRIDGTLLITSEDQTAYPEGGRLIARQTLAVNRKDAPVNTIRVFLVPER